MCSVSFLLFVSCDGSCACHGPNKQPISGPSERRKLGGGGRWSRWPRRSTPTRQRHAYVPPTCLVRACLGRWTVTALSSSTPTNPTRRQVHRSIHAPSSGPVHVSNDKRHKHWLLCVRAQLASSRLPPSAQTPNATSAADLLCSIVYGLPTTPFTTSLGTLRCTLPSAPRGPPPSPLARRRQCTGAKPRGDWSRRSRRSRIELDRIAVGCLLLAPVAAAAAAVASAASC